MAECIITGCSNPGVHNLSIRLRRPDTTAIWAPNTEAYLCNAHAEQGMTISIVLTPNQSGNIETQVSAGGTKPVSRTTPINNTP